MLLLLNSIALPYSNRIIKCETHLVAPAFVIAADLLSQLLRELFGVATSFQTLLVVIAVRVNVRHPVSFAQGVLDVGQFHVASLDRSVLDQTLAEEGSNS